MNCRLCRGSPPGSRYCLVSVKNERRAHCKSGAIRREMSSPCFHGHAPYQIIYEQPCQALEGQMDWSVLFFSLSMCIVVVSTYIPRAVSFFLSGSFFNIAVKVKLV